jgi:FkbM family methyltransferase
MRESRVVFEYAGRRFTLVAPRPDEHVLTVMKETESFYETDVLEILRDKLHRRAKRGIGIDVGAFIGTHTVFLAAMCDVDGVVAFEPDPDNHRCLVLNVASNVSERHVECRNKAVGQSHAKGVIARRSESNSGMNRIVTAGADDAAERIEVVSLDDEFSTRRHDDVALIKIDVEGSELAVVRGAKAILEQSRPLLCIEMHSAREVWRILSVVRPFRYAIAECAGFSPTYILETWNQSVVHRFLNRFCWSLWASVPVGMHRTRRGLRRIAQRMSSRPVEEKVAGAPHLRG